MSDAFIERQLDDYIWVIKESYKSSEMQELLQNYIKGSPPEYRERIKNDELSTYGMKIQDGVVIKGNGEEAKPEDLQKIEDIVDKRMLTESPALREQNLQLEGTYLFPDKKELKKKAYEELKKTKKLAKDGIN